MYIIKFALVLFISVSLTYRWEELDITYMYILSM